MRPNSRVTSATTPSADDGERFDCHADHIPDDVVELLKHQHWSWTVRSFRTRRRSRDRYKRRRAAAPDANFESETTHSARTLTQVELE